MKKVVTFLCLFLFVFIISPKKVEAEQTYFIRSMTMDVSVQKNNVYHVIQTISVDFETNHHGIYVYLPLDYDVYYQNEKLHERAHIKNIKVNDHFETEQTDGNLLIQIGSSNKEIRGEKFYSIEYDYLFGKDLFNGVDLLYYNIVGDGWQVPIENLKFTIKTPDPIAQVPNFSSKIDYKVEGNTIEGSIKNLTSELTILMTYEEGYFTGSNFFFEDKLAIAISATVLLLWLFLFFKYGLDRKPIVILSMYPPENLNCSLISYYYKKRICYEDISMLSLELASEGFLDIIQEEKKGYALVKLKDYNGPDEIKEKFMNGVFSKTKTTVSLKKLGVSYENALNSIVEKLMLEKSKIVDKKSITFQALGIVLAILFFILTFFFLGEGYYIGHMATVITVVILIFFSIFMPKRTKYGSKIYGEILGFKNFLLYAKKEELMELADKNPNYYYDIMPFAYVLGVSHVWSKKIADLAKTPPKYYQSSNGIYGHVFVSHITRETLKSHQHYTSTHQKSSGSGFSGGGHGGGGGGAW